MSNSDIAKLTKQKFKDIVKAKVRNAALQFLNQLKLKHSKMDQLKYDKLEVQQYLTSPLFNNESRTLLLRLRTRTVNGIRADFRGLYADISCPLGCGHDDTLANILTCTVLRSHHTSAHASQSDIRFEDIFSLDIRKQKEVTELYRQLLDIRNKMTSQPVASTGPMHSI